MLTGCYKITTVFSHAQTVVVCAGCATVLCQPTGGKARLTEGKNQNSVFINAFDYAPTPKWGPIELGSLSVCHHRLVRAKTFERNIIDIWL